MIHTGDCLPIMRGMPSESVDAIVTDPPAGISFMSKNWDHDKGGRTQWVAWMTEVMVECHRLLKPGGYAVVWSLPRTCHWTAWAMEDAGFIIRDQLAHVFASGFPKGKAQLKPAREDWWLARKPGPLRTLNIEETRIGTSPADAAAMERANTPGSGRMKAGGGLGGTGTFARSTPTGAMDTTSGRWPSNLLLSSPELFDEPNPAVVGSGATSVGGQSQHRLTPNDQINDIYGPLKRELGWQESYGDSGGYSRFFIIPKADRADREPVLRGQLEPGMVGGRNRADGRQWDIPGSTLDNNKPKRENTHATVKPVDLMRHLIRLVTPPGGLVLDPFLGSGSTAIAAELEGFPWIGIEKEPEYVAIAEARLNGTQRGMGLDVGAPTKRQKKIGGLEEIRAKGSRHPSNDPSVRSARSGYSGNWYPKGKPDEEPAA